MFIGMRRSSLARRAGGLAIVGVLAAGLMVATGSTATAAAPSPTPPPGVSALPGVAAAKERPAEFQPSLRLRPKDGSRSGTLVGGNCMPFEFGGPIGFGYDQYLEEWADYSYTAGVDCDFFLAGIQGEILVVDRTPAYNGQVFNGQPLGGAGIFGLGYGASGGGAFRAQARTYNGARWAEAILSLTLFAPSGTVWDYCGLVPGMYYIAPCSGLGTSVLDMQLGGFPQQTGLTQACRDLTSGLDPEQARLLEPSGNPASTRILGRIPAITNLVISFKQALCSTSLAGAASFATSRGQQLWDTAVLQAKIAANQNDDRQLYWARLSMTAAIHRWKPSSFTVDPTTRADLEKKLDWAARGMNSHMFGGTAKKVFVTGFDPFELAGSGIERGNPSGAAVLGLDNTTMGDAEIQVVIFPVRYSDFTTAAPVLGIVEEAVAVHLASGPQRAALITTVSQQPGDMFDLEGWNGRNRTDGTDNRSQPSGGTFFNPSEPGYHAPGKQFAASTLPFAAMTPITPYFGVRVDSQVYEQEFPGATPQARANGPLMPGWRAVWGSGGGYLSNEAAYRVTEMRDYFGSPVRCGHIHTPTLDLPPTDARRFQIVDQYRRMLAAAIAAVPPL